MNLTFHLAVSTLCPLSSTHRNILSTQTRGVWSNYLNLHAIEPIVVQRIKHMVSFLDLCNAVSTQHAPRKAKCLSVNQNPKSNNHNGYECFVLAAIIYCGYKLYF